MATRTRQTGTKYLVVDSDIHTIYRRACFDSGVSLKKLVDLILRSAVNDGKISEYIAELQNED